MNLYKLNIDERKNMAGYNPDFRGKYKKYVSLLLTATLLLWYVAFPITSFAQLATPTPTPVASPTPTASTTSTTPSPTPTPDPSAVASPSPTPTPDPSAVASPTPTPAASSTVVSPTPTPTASDPTSLGIANNTASSSAITGNNTITATPSASASTPSTNSGGSPSQSNGTSSGNNSNSASTTTGNATSVISQSNSINTNAINSNYINQTINIFVAQNGSINLSDPLTIAANAISTYPNDPVINISVVNVNNYTYLTNNINSQAITGQNSISTPNQNASVNTGNAYSAVSLSNQVNFTIVNSQIHVVTINIFGTLNGNIILPNIPGSQTNCNSCGVGLTANNNATVINNVNSNSNTGNNTASASAGTISTGDSGSAVNNVNLVNTNLYGTTAQVLFINNFGTWTGNFIGWGNLAPQTGGTSLVFYSISPNSGSLLNGCSSCSGALNASNSASVTNNISSTADTGGNSINTNGNASIITGNAFSVVSLINFINSNFINSFGFFTFLNIFGNWIGNIGGQKEFDALNAQVSDTTNNNPPPQQQQTTTTSGVKEQGGTLQVESHNNVNNYVYPGDTVTFFVKINNPGTGKVYGTKLILYLVKDGKLMGGTAFEIGDINAKNGKNLTTGIVLSQNAPGGKYIAKIYAYGTVGPNDTKVSATSQNDFNINGNFASSDSQTNLGIKKVLGSEYPNRIQKSAQTDNALYTLLAVLIAYMTIRITRQRKQLKELFVRNISVKEKIVSLRMFIL